MKKLFFATVASAALVTTQALAIVQGGCTEHQDPTKLSSAYEACLGTFEGCEQLRNRLLAISSPFDKCLPDVTYDECELIPASAEVTTPEEVDLASFIIVCWRSNYVEAGFDDCAVI